MFSVPFMDFNDSIRNKIPKMQVPEIQISRVPKLIELYLCRHENFDGVPGQYLQKPACRRYFAI